MSLDEITQIVPPPAEPNEIPSDPDWERVAKGLGTALPLDYKEFLAVYGSGLLGGFVGVYNPFSECQYTNLLSASRERCEILMELRAEEGSDEVPYPVFPELAGLLPWGNDQNGNDLCWLTEGAPEDWRVIVSAGRYAKWQEFDFTMTEFLKHVLFGEVPCDVWPRDLKELDGRFTYQQF